jgi:formamidopyrimidine-DNA glycosylase
MPELPEVETIVRGLRLHVVGRTITGVAVAWAKTVQSPAAPEFVAGLAGHRVAGAGRRGKYILLLMDDGKRLSIHLRMTGRLFVKPAGTEPGPHTRVVWSLDDGYELHFDDPRKFGRVALLGDDELAALHAKLGPEPLDGLMPEALAEKLRRRPSAIKTVLLDQSVVAGIGNIYADEVLFRAGINPQRPARSLSEDEIARLTEAARYVLSSAVERHGTTLSDEQFRGLEGHMGENQGYLAVFRRTGEPCYICGTPVKRVRLGGRSTHFCPHCQT